MKNILIGLTLFISSIVSNSAVLVGNTFVMNYDSQISLFGNPIVVEDTILFFPTNFKALSTGSPSIISSTFTFNITPKSGYSLSNLNLFESGDYSATGIATASGQLRVRNLNPLTSTVNQFLVSTPTPAQTSFSLAEWSITNNVNLNNSHSTQVTLENVLFAAPTYVGSFAFIEKKEVEFNISTASSVPEPPIMFLMLIGITSLIVFKKKIKV